MVESLLVSAFTYCICTEKLFAAAGPCLEGVIITDDLATQDNLIVSPEIYRRMIKPYQRRLIEFIHSKGVKVILHCCGAIRALLPDFIEMGVQIIHPVQTSARGMDSRGLKREFGKDLAFWGGGCDTQILQFGSAKEVEEEVKRRIDDFAPGGGFVFTTTHCIQPGTPVENILAMINTVKRYGDYA